MSARIVVVAGPSLGKELWIEDEVLRLGSDPSCELHLAAPDLPGHAATLEYYEGAYLVHNRGRSSLWLGEEEIEPQGAQLWIPGVTLQICGSLAITLVIEGDPAPSRRARPVAQETPMEIPDEAFDEAGQSTTGGASDTQHSGEPGRVSTLNAVKLLRVAVVVIVVAVGAGAMFIDPTSFAGGVALSPEDDFAAVLDDAQALDANLREPLQFAWQAKQRGSADEADHYYEALLEILRRREQAAGELTAAERSVAEYVRRRREEIR